MPFWISFWRSKASPALPHLRVALYTREGCHLCEDAWRLLEAARKQYGFILESVDIAADPELVARHGTWIPVVTVNGKVRFRGGVNPVLLKRLLDAEARQVDSGSGAAG